MIKFTVREHPFHFYGRGEKIFKIDTSSLFRNFAKIKFVGTKNTVSSMLISESIREEKK